MRHGIATSFQTRKRPCGLGPSSRIVGNTEVEFSLAGCRAGREQFNRSDSHVKFRPLQIMRSFHSLALSPSCWHLKKFIPCYAAALCINTPSALLTAWIEQNILLSLDSVAFDKNEETLVPEAGSCANCPKRTGFNTLLFDAALQDSCTDKHCYNNVAGDGRKLLFHEAPPGAYCFQIRRIGSDWNSYRLKIG